MPNNRSIQDKVSQKVKKLSLPLDSAGRKMTDKVPIVDSGKTMADVRDILFEHFQEFETINYIYVVNKNHKLVGVFSVREVFQNPPDKPVKEIMVEKPIKVRARTDQEKVTRLAIANSLKAIPVVDEHDKLLGVVPSDTILAILDAEMREDFYRLAGIVGRHNYEKTENLPIGTAFLKRIPWILIGILGGLLTARVIGGFESVLRENLVLAGFIPLIAYIANAVGIQTQTVYIRDLATRSKLSFLDYSLKQATTSFFIAATCWIIIWSLAFFIWQSSHLGLVVGLAVFMAILAATFFALFIPYSLQKFKLDPAIGSGPFTTIVQDLLSVIIFFSIASLLL